MSVSILHGTLMFLLCVWWLGGSFSLELEEHLFRFSAYLQRAIKDDSLSGAAMAGKYCFIDLSGNITTRNRDDGSGVDMVTNRAQLAAFMEVLARHHGEFNSSYAMYCLMNLTPMIACWPGSCL